MAALRPDDVKPLGADASHVCSQHYVSLDFINDVESHKDYAKKRVINKAAVLAFFPSKLSDSQRSVTKSRRTRRQVGSMRVLRLILLELSFIRNIQYNDNI